MEFFSDACAIVKGIGQVERETGDGSRSEVRGLELRTQNFELHVWYDRLTVSRVNGRVLAEV
jgi:hypothetical protein